MPSSSTTVADRPPIFEETTTNKTSRKIRENPMVPIGMAGFFGAVAYGIYHFRRRPPHVSASMYIMQFRVFAQSIAAGCMGMGVAYTLLKNRFTDKTSESQNSKK